MAPLASPVYRRGREFGLVAEPTEIEILEAPQGFARKRHTDDHAYVTQSSNRIIVHSFLSLFISIAVKHILHFTLIPHY